MEEAERDSNSWADEGHLQQLIDTFSPHLLPLHPLASICSFYTSPISPNQPLMVGAKASLPEQAGSPHYVLERRYESCEARLLSEMFQIYGKSLKATSTQPKTCLALGSTPFILGPRDGEEARSRPEIEARLRLWE